MSTFKGKGPLTGLPAEAAGVLGRMAKIGSVLDRIGKYHFGETWTMEEGMPPEDVAVEAFRHHVPSVKESVSPERLLIFDVREGWAPLCRFLDTEIPDEPFPRLNDAGSMQRMLHDLVAKRTMLTPFRP
ncbi:sulfotransferase [[Actinomadura] parvosata]|uniref:sulfotransferase n=1 Tax=[Actinomadura] parvosata TaxID=1955412 RepID=UPI00406CA2FA